MHLLKWLYPGMKVKRWLFLVFLGSLFITAGATTFTRVRILGTIEGAIVNSVQITWGWLPASLAFVVGGGVLFAAGLSLIFAGVRGTVNSLVGSLAPPGKRRLAEIVYEKRQLRRGPRVVVIGGGTGLGTLLRGLKEYTSNVTAVVTMADDGGSSGRIRQELGIPPPGDIRHTLVALADTEPLMERLFEYRFDWGEGLSGHSFGNLFIAAMSDITGDFEEAVRQSSRVLAVRGQVLPSTLERVTLRAEFTDGTDIEGESSIPAVRKRISRIHLEPPDPPAVREAVQAVEAADIVVIGPGSLYTSVLPNLVLPGLADALRRTRALRVYVCNVMTQPGETDGYSASDHVKAVMDHAGTQVVDCILVNTSAAPEHLLRKYAAEGAHPVEPDLKKILILGKHAEGLPLLCRSGLARHDSHDLARAVMDLEARMEIGGPMRRLKFLLRRPVSSGASSA
ncbi:MAG: YvcK family protein [Firmicutes bacterium]|nr:YvcK family protein [Bacillota bacterium]